MKKQTKILATLGPSSQSVDTIVQMIRAGANLFRLNFSHGTHEYHKQMLDKVQKASEQCGLFVGILQDISGPKVRIGEVDGRLELESGDLLEFVRDDVIGSFIEPHRARVSLNQPVLLDRVEVDQMIFLADGSLRTKVISKDSNTVICEVQNSATITSKKGVNFPQTVLGLDVLTQKDRDDMAWGVKHGVDFMAISFVQSAKDMQDARDHLSSLGGTQQLVAKIEKFDAVENIDSILKLSDAIMVARGDLGIEIPYFKVPTVQKMLIKKANEAHKPVITATQMLLSMTSSERATRAEISDVANAVLDGTDCVMLSEESAVGEYPIKSVVAMTHTIVEIEKIYPHYKLSTFTNNDEMDAINESAVLMSKRINAKAILAITSSGQSAKKLSRYRPKKPILAVTHDIVTARSLTLVWGVAPAFLTLTDSVDEMLIEVIQSGIARGVLDKNSSYILTAGDPVGVPGTTNTIKILRKNEIEYFASATLKQCTQEMPRG